MVAALLDVLVAEVLQLALPSPLLLNPHPLHAPSALDPRPGPPGPLRRQRATLVLALVGLVATQVLEALAAQLALVRPVLQVKG